MKNGKELQIEILVNSKCTHIGIDEQLVKDKRIQTRSIFTITSFNNSIFLTFSSFFAFSFLKI